MFVESVESFPKRHPHLAPELVGYCLPSVAKPFLKWVGGKSQLIDQLDANVPPELSEGLVKRYIEPFVGGGSFFFHVAQTYQVQELVIADSNQDLVLAYWTIKDRVDSLITKLYDIQVGYLALSEAERQDYYYRTRKTFNENKSCIDTRAISDAWVERTAQLIFLNKTCFNGLFRVNAAGFFNVAFGRYDNPKICDPNNLVAVSQILERTEIRLGDFTCVRDRLDAKTFAYLDPPYRPLSETSNFTAYSSSTFTDADQQRLALFCNEASKCGSKLMISNSDPDNIGSKDTYFEDNYPDYRVVRAFANRMVNCKAEKRGKISELIIMNYPSELIPEIVEASNVTTVPTRRNAAALGAYQLLHECAKDARAFTMEDLQQATGWKLQTARTYVSKKWKNYLEPVADSKPAEFKVASDFLRLTEQSFLAEFSQVLSGKMARPENIEEARTQVLSALATYAEMLGEQNNAAESQVRQLIEKVSLVIP